MVSDTNADILAGSEFWRPALPFLSAALGIIIWGLFLFLIFRLVIDMTFLINNGGFLEPLFIKWYDNDSRNGVITRVQQDGGSHPFYLGGCVSRVFGLPDGEEWLSSFLLIS